MLRRFLYYPEPLPREAPVPLQAHARDAEEVFLPTADGELVHALWWPPPEAPDGTRRPTLLYLHGNAGHVFDWSLVRVDLKGCDCGLLLLDYRGYGKSSGKPTEEGLYHDGRACLAFLAERGVAPGDTVILGKSLGGGVATELARGREDLRGLILESTFTSIQAVARKLFPFLPIGAILPDRYESAKKLEEARCPVFVIHGERDGLIPPSEGRALYAAARYPKRLWMVPAADHNDVAWVSGSDYAARIRAFLDDPIHRSPAP